MVLGYVFSVLHVRPLTRMFHQLNLAWSVSKLAVFFATSKSEIEAIAEDNGVQKALWNCVTKQPFLPKQLLFIFP